jgi:hypothetical protein
MERILSLEDELAPPTFMIDGEINRQYSCFNTVGTQLTVRLLPPSDATDPVNHFLASVTELIEYALRYCSDSDMVGITIRNEVNEQDKPVGRKDQVSGDVIGNVLGRVAQSNARFDVMYRLIVTVHSVKMPVGFGGIKTKGRQLSVMAHLKEYRRSEGRTELFSARASYSNRQSK